MTGQHRVIAHDIVMRLLTANGIQCSMSRRGDCWDNAAMESFFSTLKTERAHRRHYRTRDETHVRTGQPRRPNHFHSRSAFGRCVPRGNAPNSITRVALARSSLRCRTTVMTSARARSRSGSRQRRCLQSFAARAPPRRRALGPWPVALDDSPTHGACAPARQDFNIGCSTCSCPSTRRLTARSTGRAGSCFLGREHRRGAPVSFVR